MMPPCVSHQCLLVTPRGMFLDFVPCCFHWSALLVVTLSFVPVTHICIIGFLGFCTFSFVLLKLAFCFCCPASRVLSAFWLLALLLLSVSGQNRLGEFSADPWKLGVMTSHLCAHFLSAVPSCEASKHALLSTEESKQWPHLYSVR